MEVVRGDLLNEYRAGAEQWKAESQDLGTVLRKLLPVGYPMDGPRITIGEKRLRTWQLPSLDECRAQFEKDYRMSDCWGDE